MSLLSMAFYSRALAHITGGQIEVTSSFQEEEQRLAHQSHCQETRDLWLQVRTELRF